MVRSSSLDIEVGAETHRGYVRNENQDRLGHFDSGFGPVFVIADGMGGHRGGGLAAELAVHNLERQLREASLSSSVEDAIRTAFERTNELVYQKAHSGDPEVKGMGTTVVLALLARDRCWIAHVGDSRAYRYRNGRLERWTSDHTRVQRMVAAGILSEDQALNHPDANVLDRAVGHQLEIEVEIRGEPALEPGEALLLCSDGLWGYVREAEIERVLRANGDAQHMCDRLLQLALDAGGEDNISVQYLRLGANSGSSSGTSSKRRSTRELPEAGIAAHTSVGQGASMRRAVRPGLIVAIVLAALVVAVAVWYWSALHRAPAQTSTDAPAEQTGRTETFSKIEPDPSEQTTEPDDQKASAARDDSEVAAGTPPDAPAGDEGAQEAPSDAGTPAEPPATEHVPATRNETAPLANESDPGDMGAAAGGQSSLKGTEVTDFSESPKSERKQASTQPATSPPDQARPDENGGASPSDTSQAVGDD